MKKLKHNSILIKFIVILATIVITTVTIAGCGKKAQTVQTDQAGSTNYETLEIKYQGWTGQVTLCEIAEDLGYLKPLTLNWVGNTISGPQDIQAVATGDIDLGAAFGTAIINLKATGAPITWVINSGGCDEKSKSELLVLEGSPIKTARDLIGKKVAVNTLAAHNEVMIKQYLKKNNLTDEEIEKVSLVIIPPVNEEQTLRQNQVDAAVIGGIHKDKAFEKGGLRSLISDLDTWGAKSSSGIVFRDKFIKENPNTSKKLVEGLAKAIEWYKSTPEDEVRARLTKIIDNRNRNENSDAIKYWKSSGVAEKGGLVNSETIQFWIDSLVSSGSLKTDQIKPKDVFTNELNPYNEEKK